MQLPKRRSARGSDLSYYGVTGIVALLKHTGRQAAVHTGGVSRGQIGERPLERLGLLVRACFFMAHSPSQSDRCYSVQTYFSTLGYGRGTGPPGS
jgi:hypothetical protein